MSSPSAAGRTRRPRVVYLHVGSPKTGTTHLQHMLDAHRDRLAEDGVFYPPSRGSAHHDEARDLRGVRLSGGGHHHPAVPGSWPRTAQRVREWDGGDVVVVSSETLAFATALEARRAVRSLEPAEVHLVITMRDLVRQVPALWQESVKNRSTTSYAEFLRLLEADGPGPQHVWDGQDPTRILDRWGKVVRPERVHLVTVPPRGADGGRLWERFAGVLGIDPTRYPAVPRGANPSLGVAEAEVVRQLNEGLLDVSWRFYTRHVKNGLAQGVLVEPSALGQRLVLPESAVPMVEARAERIHDAVVARGYDVVGDLDDLMVSRAGDGVGKMPEPDPDELSRAFATASAYLVAELARARGVRRRLRQ